MYRQVKEFRLIYGWVPGPAGLESDLCNIHQAWEDGLIDKAEYRALKRFVQFEELLEAA